MPSRIGTSPLLRALFAVVLTVLCVSLAGSIPRSSAQSAAKERHAVLPLGLSIPAVLRAGETHVWDIYLHQGEALRAVVEQRGVDVEVTLFDPEGGEVVYVDTAGPNGSIGPEVVDAVAERAGGVFQLRVRAFGQEMYGRYGLRMEAPRSATPRDRTRATALKVYGEAERLQLHQDEASMRQALTGFQEALGAWRRLGDESQREALTLRRIGQAHFVLSEFQEAVARFEESLTLYGKLEDAAWSATLENDIGQAHLQLGNFDEAGRHFERALRDARNLGHPDIELTALGNLGNMYSRRSRYEDALELFEQELAGWRELQDRNKEALALHNLGNTYSKLLRFRESLNFLSQARDLSSRNPRLEASNLNSIGLAYQLAGRPWLALGFYERAIRLRQQVGDLRGLAVSLDHQATAFRELGRWDEALAAYRRSFQILDQIGDEFGKANSLASIGWVHDVQGDTARTLDAYREALPMMRGLGDRSGEAAVLLGMAQIERRRGQHKVALGHARSAIQLVESMRDEVGRSSLRISFLASRHDYYEVYIDLLMDLDRREPGRGHAARAFEVSEWARARGLLEGMQSSGRSWKAADPTLGKRINAQAQRVRGLRDDERPRTEIKAAERELTELLLEREKLRRTSPDAAVEPLSLAEIQSQVLDEESLLLEYALGEERSYLWVVGPRSINHFTLPGRAEIERLSRDLHERLAESRGKGRPAPGKTIRAARLLAEKILAPALPLLKGKRLLIVSDGALQYVPFNALPIPSSSEYVPLIVEHEVHDLPSASVLALLRRRLADRQPAPGHLALLGDSVFDTTDERFGGAASLSPVKHLASAELERAARDFGLPEFVRLEGASDEIDAILALVLPENALVARSWEASKDLVLSGELERYRILHFATHGLLHAEYPELSGLVLSLVDRRGRPRDGFLRVHEIYDLDLPADLVVLSACRTAVGQEVRGEGLMGLTQAFFQAGAARLVVSRWNASDRGTEVLMERFYRGMFQEGLRPSQALRQAQLSMLRERDWQSPYYWAVFSLQGEWR
jgi:CHAT domain-containing protein/tetratricopeptide (TPR) repeat protein